MRRSWSCRVDQTRRLQPGKSKGFRWVPIEDTAKSGGEISTCLLAHLQQQGACFFFNMVSYHRQHARFRSARSGAPPAWSLGPNRAKKITEICKMQEQILIRISVQILVEKWTRKWTKKWVAGTLYWYSPKWLFSGICAKIEMPHFFACDWNNEPSSPDDDIAQTTPG